MYQFAHVNSYSRKPKQGKKANEIAKEAERHPDHVRHLTERGIEPQKPIQVFGCTPSEAVEKAEAWGDQARDAKGRKRRIDAPVLLAGVISYPRHGEEWPQFKAAAVEWLKREYGENLVSIVEHQDEQHPHMHFYAVPRPGQAFDSLHEGRAASAKAKREGQGKGDQRIAHNNAMRAWQDRFHEAVGKRFGLARLGPKRQRLTTPQWKSQQAAYQAIAAVERVGRVTRKPTKKERKSVFENIEGKSVGLLRKEHVYTEDELYQVANKALSVGISMQMEMQGDAAARAAQIVAERQIQVNEQTHQTKAQADEMAAKLAASELELSAYREAMRQQREMLAMSEIERRKQAVMIQTLEGFRDSLSDQLNEAEERLRELQPKRKQRNEIGGFEL
ncbi:plasmid recombination protein [Aeromonas veronii]|uniref:plasmid recombination protein n=1 Tax=Aeromonas veronii TaxID=654 RepID=UPI003D1D2AF2